MNSTTDTLPTADVDRHQLAATLFRFIFWIVYTAGFVIDEWMPGMESLRSSLWFMLELVLVAVALMLVRSRWVWTAVLAFMALTWLSTTQFNDISSGKWLNGLREFIGIALVYPVTLRLCDTPEHRRQFFDNLDRDLLIFLCLQVFCIFYQVLIYGSGDNVGGSLGHCYSGQISISIYLASYFLLRRRIDYNRLGQSLQQNWYLIALLIPTFLNETKVSFVMLALYALLLLPIDRKLLVRLTFGLPLLVGVMWLTLQIYTVFTEANHLNARFESVEELAAYFMIENIENAEKGAQWDMENLGVVDVPRFTKLMYLPILNEEEPGHAGMGYGLGHFKGGNIGATRLAQDYDWLLVGSIPYLFHVYIQLGLFGIALLVAFTVFLFWYNPNGGSRDTALQLMLAATILLTFLYNDALRNLAFCLLIFSLLTASWKPKEQV